MEQKFTGVFIPAKIFNMKELSWAEKILWCEIQALSGDDGCYATNEYFAEQFGTTPEKISNKISKLKKLGLVEQISFDGRVRKIRALFDGQDSISKKDNADLPKTARQTCQNGQGYNKYNIKYNIKNKEKEKEKESNKDKVKSFIKNFGKFVGKNQVLITKDFKLPENEYFDAYKREFPKESLQVESWIKEKKLDEVVDFVWIGKQIRNFNAKNNTKSC